MFFDKNTVRHYLNKIRRIPIEWDLKTYRKRLVEIKRFNFEGLSDKDLARRSSALRGRARADGPFEGVLDEAAALVREAARRAVGLRPYDIQIIAGLALHAGRLIEMQTGEGKTLAAVLPAYLAALSGRGAHVLTFNDYLARRDAAWMGPVYRRLGMSVGVIQQGRSPESRRAAYRADVTYATAREAGFDFLRDQIALAPADRVHRDFHFALVDEADSILIDEARVPLVIAGEAGPSDASPQRLAVLARGLVEGEDFDTDEGRRNINLSDRGTVRVEGLLECGSLHASENLDLLTRINLALHAEYLLRRDVDYIVRGKKVEIVDEFTGRVVEDRHWPDGLQAAVEAKEGLRRGRAGEVLGRITLQHYLGLYPRLAGMTATARPAADELFDFYGLTTVVLPTHRPCIRRDEPDRVFCDRESKMRALVVEIGKTQSRGRPVLVGTASVRESEELADRLRAGEVACQVLNAKNDEEEAAVIARAGAPGAVTISTNMAGRGTDIKLGGAGAEDRAAVAALGGLYVIGTNRHESLRIDRQLRGRAGRQGDPGTSRFFISLEDPIFVRYGLREQLSRGLKLPAGGQAIDHPRVLKEVAWGQRRVESQNYEIRRTLWRYSQIGERQRALVQDRRREILCGGPEASLLEEAAPELWRAWRDRIGAESLEKIERRITLFHMDRAWSEFLAWFRDTRDSIHLVAAGGRKPLNEFQKMAAESFGELDRTIDQRILKTLEALAGGDGDLDLAAAGVRSPSSTWTYLVNDNIFEELARPQNIGFHAVAIASWGPIWLIPKILQRQRERKARKAAADRINSRDEVDRPVE